MALVMSHVRISVVSVILPTALYRRKDVVCIDNPTTLCRRSRSRNGRRHDMITKAPSPTENVVMLHKVAPSVGS